MSIYHETLEAHSPTEEIITSKPMTKSELLARYDNFRGGEIIEVSRAEFYDNLNKETYRNWEQASTSIQSYRIDGAEYFLYSSIWNVGWHGDCDYDEFFFKIERMTQQEIEDMMKWMR